MDGILDELQLQLTLNISSLRTFKCLYINLLNVGDWRSHYHFISQGYEITSPGGNTQKAFSWGIVPVLYYVTPSLD